MRLFLMAALLAGLAGPAAADQKDFSIEVCAKGGPRITVTASPMQVAPGGAVTISWTAPDAVGGWFTVSEVGRVEGTSTIVRPTQVGDKTYTITGHDKCGGQGMGQVTVKVGFKKVFLSGSRYYTPPSVGDYMIRYTVDPSYGAAEGASVHRFVDSRGGEAAARFNDFAGKVKSWPRSAEAFSRSHVAGRTYIVDETGKVLGDLNTWSLFSNGLPGLNYLGNPWGNGDYNKVFVGNGTLDYGGITYDVVGFVSVSPIVLDLDGDDAPDVDRGEWLPHPARFNQARSVMFDINADGFPDITEWIGKKDGLLVAPIRKSGTVKGENLFGNPIGFMDGYQKLGLRYDKDESGAIEGSELEDLLVWQDSNSDGKAQPSELKGVTQLGITSISTSHENLKSKFTINGKERSTWDWWPTCMLVYPKPLAKLP